MKSILLMLLALVSLNVFAQQLQLPFAEEEKIHIKKLLEVGYEMVGNGDCDQESYNVAEFNYSQELKRLLEIHNDDPDRGYNIVAELKWKYILNNSTISDTEFTEELKYFLDNKKIQAMYMLGPDNACEESEYCSYSYLYIYLKSGVVLYFNFDHTT